MRVKILCYEYSDRGLPFGAQLLAKLQEAGFAADFAPKSLQDLGMKVKSVARFVEKHPADAWVIIAGTREILNWFANGPVPALALFGRHTQLPIAASSPLKGPALVSVVGKLIDMGHRRIVMLSREERRKPYPGPLEQKFLDEMEAHGLMTGKYNLPDWDEHTAGLRTALDSSFRNTPPTALIIPEPAVFVATRLYLSQMGISIPKQVSVVCTDFDPIFKWFDPQVSHIHWSLQPVLNRVVRWATNVSHGKLDKRQTTFKAKLVEGGTIGPAPKDQR